MRNLAALVIVCAAGLVAATPARAQAPIATPTAAPTQPVPPAVEPPPAEPYSHNADGRRDPFLSLTGGATTADRKSMPKPAAAGIAGIRVDELSVRGIMQSRERLVAMVQGPDNRTYLIHQGDKLADGAVKSITPQGLVLVQDVSDPRSQEKSREVRKPLRSAEDEKE